MGYDLCMSVVQSEKLPHIISASNALDWFRRASFHDIPPYFLTHWKTNKEFFYANDQLLAFEETPSHFVVAGEALASKRCTHPDILEAFQRYASRRDKGICGYYVGESWDSKDFKKTPLGTSICIRLKDFDLKSPESKEVRRSLRKGKENDYRVIPLRRKDRMDQHHVATLYKKWKRAKLPLPIKFLLSSPKAKNPVSNYEEWFVVEKEGRYIAFCSLVPYLKDGSLSFYVDHLIYDPDSDPHALGFLMSFLLEIFKEEGVEEVNLGLNPFARLSGTRSMEKLFSLLYKFPVLYKPKSLHYFKSKFGGEEQPEFCFFHKQNSQWRGLAEMARVTLM